MVRGGGPAMGGHMDLSASAPKIFSGVIVGCRVRHAGSISAAASRVGPSGLASSRRAAPTLSASRRSASVGSSEAVRISASVRALGSASSLPAPRCRRFWIAAAVVPLSPASSQSCAVRSGHTQSMTACLVGSSGHMPDVRRASATGSGMGETEGSTSWADTDRRASPACLLSALALSRSPLPAAGSSRARPLWAASKLAPAAAIISLEGRRPSRLPSKVATLGLSWSVRSVRVGVPSRYAQTRASCAASDFSSGDESRPWRFRSAAARFAAVRARAKICRFSRSRWPAITGSP